jgi:protein-disulfide isomerase
LTRSLCLNLALLLGIFLVTSWSYASQGDSEAIQGVPHEEVRLEDRISDAVLKRLKESDWLQHEIEVGIQRHFAKQAEALNTAKAEQARVAAERVKLVRHVSQPRDHIHGNPEAPISLIEYSDFECPFCKRFHSVPPEVVEAYGEEVNWVFRHFPLEIHNPKAQKEAEATECAYEQGGDAAFWKYTDAIFAKTDSKGRDFSVGDLVTMARDLGLESQAFQACLDSGTTTSRVREDALEGIKIGITGTPTTILINKRTGEVRVRTGAVTAGSLMADIAQILDQ